MGSYRRQHTLEVSRDLVVPKAQHLECALLQPLLPYRVLWPAVLSAIKLDN
jgi:hypothetical protein